MEIRRGTPVSPGIVIGPAFVFESEGVRIARKFIMPDEAPHEVARFDKALQRACDELDVLRKRLAAQVDGEALADIFQAHLHIISDPGLREKVITLVNNKHFTPEYAVSEALRRYAAAFERMDDEFLSQRKSDIYDIERRILTNLVGEKREDLAHLKQAVIIVAPNLTPSQTVSLDRDKILGFVTDAGGRTSHTAILARALAIPAVVGLGSISSEISGGDMIVVDGSQGIVIVGPDDSTIKRYKARQQEFSSTAQRMTAAVQDLPSITADGTEIVLKGNIEFPNEVAPALAEGAAGIGLYRTEFLFHSSGGPPDEKAHYAAYTEALRQLDGKPITIRCLDLGADKFPAIPNEANPFLGCRSIRLLLRKPELLLTQIRAILRASAHGNIRFMFPLVSTVPELRQAKRMVAEVRAQFDREGIDYDHDIKMGIMIEVPSAAVMAGALAAECDFFSVGTNDLIQYTLAVDRDNAEVAPLYSASDPSVLRLIDMTVRGAREHGIPVALCGEMAGDPLYTVLLVGLGITEMSMAARAIPELKRIIRAVSVDDARKVAEEALKLETVPEIERLLEERTRAILPEGV